MPNVRVALPLFDAGPVTGCADDLLPMLLQQLGRLDTQTWVVALVLFDIAMSNDTRMIGINVGPKDLVKSTAVVSWDEVAKRRGWNSLDKHNRRQRQQESVRVLLNVLFSLDLQDGLGGKLENVSLFS